MPSIRKKPNSRYFMMRYRNDEGRLVERSTKQTDRKKAWQMALDMERMVHKAKAGELTRSVAAQALNEILERTTGDTMPNESIENFFNNFEQSKAVTGISLSSLKQYRSKWRKFLEFIGPKRAKASVGSVTVNEIEKFRDHLLGEGMAPTTVNHYVKVIGVALESARRKGLAKENPALAVERVHAIPDERQPFTDAQVKKLLKAANDEWRGMILLGYHTGIRLNDAANLTWDNIDRKRNVLTYLDKKTSGRKRTANPETRVYLHADVIQWLDTQPASVGKASLFPSLHGKTSGSAGGLSNAFNRVMDSAGVQAPLGAKKTGKGRQFRKLSFHSLRHTFISRLANENVSADVRKEMAGHSSDEMHARYVHMDISAQEAAISKMKGVL